MRRSRIHQLRIIRGGQFHVGLKMHLQALLKVEYFNLVHKKERVFTVHHKMCL